MVDCDIILLVWNQPAITRRCIESLFACTHRPVRLLIVDNGSDAPTREYLATVVSQGSIEVIHLHSETNEGFARGMNRGLRASTAPWVCLLNNDVILTEGWLDRMLEVGQAHPDIGLINPVSNTFGDRPASGVTLAEHAAAVGARPAGYVESGACVGFCWLIRRAVIERVGVLDEAMGLVFFEDTDYSRRAAQAGFRSVVAGRAYVFHEEHASVRLLPQRRRIFQENKRRFEARWGRTLRIGYLAPEDATTPPTLAPHLRQAVWLVRRNALVQIFIPGATPLNPRACWDATGMVPHADVGLVRIPRGRPGRAWVWWRLMNRRVTLRPPKLFDLCLVPDARFARALAGWRGWHGADVLLQSDHATLDRLWPTRSQSPSS